MYKRFSLLLIMFIMLGLVGSKLSAQGPLPVADVQPLSLVLVVDTSGSMAGERLTALRATLRAHVENSAAASFALMTYDDNVRVVIPFTSDAEVVLTALDDLQVLDGSKPSALYEAVLQAADLAGEAATERAAVVFVTDGTHTSERSTTSRDAALEALAASGVPVYSLGLGSDADFDFLRAMTERSDGEMMALADLSNLDTVVSRLWNAMETSPAVPLSDPSLALVGNEWLTEAVVESADTGGLIAVGDGDAAVVLAVDISESMTGSLIAQVQDSASTFVETLDGAVPVALLSFGSQVSLVEDFNTSPAAIVAALQGLTPGGVTALYDGALEAVQTAVDRDTPNRVVILVGDGAEYGGQSAADRGAALELALQHDVRVYTIGLGNSVDSAFLEELALGTGATFFRAATPDELTAVYADIAETVLAAHQAETSPYIQPLDLLAQLPPLLQLDGLQEALPNLIAPLDAEFQPVEAEPVTPGEPALVEATRPEAASPPAGLQAVTPDSLSADVFQPFSPIVPVTVEVAEGEAFGAAELYVNGEFLAVADSAPYQYTLDTRMLLDGTYQLEIVAETLTSGYFSDVLEVEVAVVSELPLTGAEALLPEPDTAAPTAPDALRVVLVDGEAQPLHLMLSQQTGLTLFNPPQTEVEVAQAQSLADILASPLDSLPEPVRRILLEQHPVAVSILIIVLTVILLPQGLFTIYWMTYSWVNERRMERSGAPESYYDPLYSFTALVPARREEKVLYDTIMAVHRIDYPDDMKEILVLIRDDDDDETIAAANRAIADIQHAARAAGRDGDNVRLITFKDGPKNKPNGLNRGYREATNDVICIFDAEDQPHTEVYHVINTVMQRDGADVVQSGVQLMNFRSNWFSAFNVLEYFFWFKSGLHAFTHGLHVTPLGGNTVFFKREWLDKLAAQDTEKGYRVWDEYCLTEDADIGIRLTSMGASIQIVYEARQATQEETPANVDQFIKQRTRWSQGFYEIFFKFDWRHLPTLKQRLGAIYILLNSLLQGAIIFFLPIGLFIWATQVLPVGIAILSWMPVYLLFIQLTINLIGIREFTEAYGLKLPFLFRLRMVIYYYPYQLLLSISAVRAMIRYATRQSSWEKTEHSNLHRTSASARTTLRA